MKCRTEKSLSDIRKKSDADVRCMVEDAQSAMAERWRSNRNRLLEWHEEVSHIRINSCLDSYDFTLHAYGTGDPLILHFSLRGSPEVRMDLAFDREAIEKLALWLLECSYAREKLGEKIRSEIDASIRKSKRARSVHASHELEDRPENDCQIRIPDFPDEYSFSLRGHGVGFPPEETLIVSVYHHSGRKMEREIGIGQQGIDEFADWLLDCLVLLDWLRKKKEADLTDALRTRRELMRKSEYIPNED